MSTRECDNSFIELEIMVKDDVKKTHGIFYLQQKLIDLGIMCSIIFCVFSLLLLFTYDYYEFNGIIMKLIPIGINTQSFLDCFSFPFLPTRTPIFIC